MQEREKRTDRQRTFKWHITLEDLAATKLIFLEHGFIDEKWNVPNWEKRQYISDSSTERVRRHRAKKAHETRETKCNAEDAVTPEDESRVMTQVGTGETVTVTAPDTDADAEQIQNQMHKEPLSPAGAGAAQKPAKGKSDKSRAKDERHAEFKGYLKNYWNYANPGLDMPWDGAEGQALGMFVRGKEFAERDDVDSSAGVQQ